MKVSAYGVKGFLIRNANIYDILILFLSFLYISSERKIKANYSPLRILRILRLIQINNFQRVFRPFLSSCVLLLDALSILCFFLLFFALIGLHLFYGLFKNDCISLETGLNSEIFLGKRFFCGNSACPENLVCAKGLSNPDSNTTDFDDIFHSLLQVFKILTLSGWSDSLYKMQKTFSDYAWVYPVSIIFLGNYFLMNLLFSVLKVKFIEHQKIARGGGEEKKKERRKFDLRKCIEEKNFFSKKSKISVLQAQSAMAKRKVSKTSNAIVKIQFNENKTILGRISDFFGIGEHQREKNMNEIYLDVRVKQDAEYVSCSEEDVFSERF